MPKTVNRRVTSVNTPSKSDIKNYFFTHSNWKGLSNDENFLTVDQETFSDCNNIYMNSEGLLKSRPSLKIKTVKVTLDGEEIVLSDVLECIQYTDVVVYRVKKDNDYKLVFVPKDASAIQVSCEEKIKLLNVEDKIFIFSENSLEYYDITTNNCLNAENFIYIPVTKINSEGIWSDLEPANELTDSCIYRYIYDNVNDNSNIDFSIFINKRVAITIGDNVYYVNFVDGTESIFLDDERILSDKNFISIGNCKYPLVSVCKTGQYIISYIEEAEISELNQYKIYYTPDGLLFRELPKINDVIGFPKISSDGYYAICLKKDDLYVCSLVDTSDNDVYLDWTPLIKTKDENFNIKIQGDIPWENIDSIPEMYNIDNFVIYFSSLSSASRNVNRGLLVCDNGEFSYKYLSLSKRLNGAIFNFTSFRVYEEYENNLEVITLSNMHSDISDVYSKNKLRLQFSDITVTNEYIDGNETNDNGTPIDNRFHIDATIKVQLVRANGRVIDKFTEEVAWKIDVVRWNKVNGDKGMSSVFVDFSIFSAQVILYTHATGTGFVECSLKLNVSSDEYIDIEYDGGTYRISNSYRNTPNIAYNINSNNCTYLVDVSAVYKLDVTNNLNYCLINRMIPSDSNKSTLSNGLFIEGDDCRIAKSDGMIAKLFTTENNFGEYGPDLIRTNGLKYDLRCIFDYDGNLITNDIKYVNANKDNRIALLFEIIPISFYSHFYACTFDKLYSNNITKNIFIDEVIQGANKYILPDEITEIENYYLSVDKTLYISSYINDGDFKWYLPKISTEKFDSTINKLHAISDKELAVFLDNSIYYIQRSEDKTPSGIFYYLYYKSKIQVGLKNSADVITSFDGKYTIFPSNRGLVALTYQELTSSTEQVLTFLSDSIHKTFNDFNTDAIKLYKYEYWIVCYKKNNPSLLLFDVRNNSWWPINLPFVVDNILTLDDKPVIISSGKMYDIDKSNLSYYDDDGLNEYQIDWNFKSQKLHLNTVNYYKHISNITLTSVLDNNMLEPLDLDLIVTNYRKRANTTEAENFSFNVDAIRTFVKRLNYSKVNEFQYLLKCDEYNSVRIPLSLSSINIKYKVSNEVR